MFIAPGPVLGSTSVRPTFEAQGRSRGFEFVGQRHTRSAFQGCPPLAQQRIEFAIGCSRAVNTVVGAHQRGPASVAAHPAGDAELAAEAAEAAAAQGKFWEMHNQLFTHSQNLKPESLTHYAEAIGLDMRRFSADMADRIHLQRVKEHRRAGEQIGLRSSPSFLLNGKLVDVSFGLEHLEHAVRAALGKSAP